MNCVSRSPVDFLHNVLEGHCETLQVKGYYVSIFISFALIICEQNQSSFSCHVESRYKSYMHLGQVDNAGWSNKRALQCFLVNNSGHHWLNYLIIAPWC